MTDSSLQRNVFGAKLEPCSKDPETGFRRDGCCHEHPDDRGRHELCAVLTEEFLQYSKAQGNDLITPRPELDFPGLEPGDRWCLCVGRWIEAKKTGVAPPIVLEATNESVLSDIDTSTLKAHEYER